jgi:Zn-dependent peptidase ImmA (M78 family)
MIQMDDTTLTIAKRLFQTDKGATVEELASNSAVRFVRSQFQLAIADPDATGFLMSASDALYQYGWSKLSELAEYTSAVLVEQAHEPKGSFRRRASDLGLDLDAIQKQSGWSVDEIANLASDRQVGFRQLDRLAASLGIRQQDIGRKLPETKNDLGARLRSLKAEGQYTLTEDVVTNVALSSRLSADHADLMRQYGDRISVRESLDRNRISGRLAETKKSVIHRLPYQQGFALADALREEIGYRWDQPINRVGNLIECRLGILLLFSQINAQVTGLSVENDGERAILINSAAYGADIFVRRIALAHELCHVLVDSYEEFAVVKVDQERIFDDNIAKVDRTEARANAFAAQLLAPQRAICDLFDRYGGNENAINRLLMEFGVGFTVIRHQLENGLGIETRSGAFTPLEAAYSKWISQERPFYTRIPVKFGLEDIRKNRLSLIALLLLRNGALTADRVESILGYPVIKPHDIADGIFQIDYFRNTLKQI